MSQVQSNAAVTNQFRWGVSGIPATRVLILSPVTFGKLAKAVILKSQFPPAVGFSQITGRFRLEKFLEIL